jgi:prepilin-type N-terminal cleavage/methylation domain-containing protein
MKRIKGFTLIELLIVVAIIAILAAIAVPNFLEAQVRSKVSRVRTDQRSLATAIESYYVDNNSYPASTTDQNANAYGGTTALSYDNRTFAVRNATDNDFNTLTTPISYITSYFPDPFQDQKQFCYLYWGTRLGWILGSPGPDTDASSGGQLWWNQPHHTDLDGPLSDGVETVYNPRVAQPSSLLLAGEGTSHTGSWTYDPTNGTISDGDLWRVKQ